MTRARPAVLIMAKAPQPGLVKTRLHPLLGPAGCAALQRELIRHTVSVTSAVPGVSVFVAVDPPESAGQVRDLVPAGTRLLPQGDGGLGERLAAASAEVFAASHRPVAVIGTDVPALTPALLTLAFAEVARGRDAVFGPACDGGYYLVALARPAPGLFALDPALWGGSQVLAASLAAARRSGLTVGLLPVLRDLDTPADARALLAGQRLPGGISAALRPRPEPWRQEPTPGLAPAGTPTAPGDERAGRPAVSIVVPVLNEAATIETALRRLRRDFPGCELIVADGGSTDGTAALAAPLARVVRSEAGRARQMNAAARRATGDVLWFIHADTQVEPAALRQIRHALADPGTVGGGLRLRFDRAGFALGYVAWTSNLRARYLHWVFGDQAMFIRRRDFEELGGYPDLPIMEDLEMSRRLRRHGRLAVLPATATTSARRFTEHGAWRMLAFLQYLKLAYFLGADPRRIAGRYRTGPRLKPGRLPGILPGRRRGDDDRDCC